jgi:hypothetical protein
VVPKALGQEMLRTNSRFTATYCPVDGFAVWVQASSTRLDRRCTVGAAISTIKNATGQANKNACPQSDKKRLSIPTLIQVTHPVIKNAMRPDISSENTTRKRFISDIFLSLSKQGFSLSNCFICKYNQFINVKFRK